MQELNNKESVTSNTDVENQNIPDIEIEIEEQSFDDEETTNDEFEEKSSRFKEGEILSMIRVRFPGNSKSFPFYVGKRKFAYGQKVVAMSDRGMTVGYINSFPYDVEFNKTMLPIRSIAKVASEDDIKAQQDFRDSEKKAEVVCIRLIDKFNLEMVLTHVEFIQFGKKAVFYFNAPERVDFRELVKELVADLKMRIELRQISVRDRAAALGAVGACGLQTCCSSFLKNYGNVSIKMAKNQNLALIPSKLNGVCGQIKCCIKYEDDVYADKRKLLPKENTIIKTKNGDIGKVLRLHLLVEQFEILTDFGAKRRYASVEFIGEDNLPAGYKFPEVFDHVVDETKEVIGLVKAIQVKSEQFIDEMEELEDEDFNEEDEDLNDGDDEDSVENNSIEAELNAIEGSLKSTKPTQNQHSNKNDNRPQNRPNNNQQRSEQNKNPNHGQNQNRDNRNNNRPERDNRNNKNFKPRHNNNNAQNGNKDNRPQNNPNRQNNSQNSNGNQQSGNRPQNRPQNNQRPEQNRNQQQQNREQRPPRDNLRDNQKDNQQAGPKKDNKNSNQQ